ncbi:MAG: sulfotransferase domain-containing protein [Pseudomonadota bacterium]
MTGELSRATDIAGVHARNGRLFTAESREAGNAYRANPDDVIIATYPKCGTTLMQQIAHGLRTRGDMDFGEITEVVPWLETSLDMGVDVYAEQKAWPKTFKSHQSWEEVPKGARYIYVIRDPKDAAVSFYHFYDGWVFEPGSIDLDTFIEEFVLKGTRSGRYAAHLTSWWHKRNDADTLMLCFEDITRNLAATAELVCRFMGLEPDAERLAIATHQSSIDFMRAHKTKYDDHPIRLARNVYAGLPSDASSSKVREGATGGHREMRADLLARFDAIWTDEIAPKTGHADYASLRSELRRF